MTGYEVAEAHAKASPNKKVLSMKSVRIIFLIHVFLLASCSDERTDETPIDKSEVQSTIAKANNGDRRSHADLVLYYSEVGDTISQELWHKKCLAIGEPRCLGDQASTLYFDAINPRLAMSTPQKRENLVKAQNLMLLAVKNAYDDDPEGEELQGYNLFLGLIKLELLKLPAE